MAIRFRCSSCRQPIEIDDEFANQSVACPYCRAVVKAPASSEALTGTGPTAAPDSAASFRTTADSPGTAQPPNWFANAGLICAVIIMLCLAVIVGVFFKTARQVGTGGPLTTEQTRQVQEKVLQSPLMVVVSFVVVGSSLAGVVFSILGLTKRTGRRWQAITGLTICGLMMACQCLGIVVNLAMSKTGGS